MSKLSMYKKKVNKYVVLICKKTDEAKKDVSRYLKEVNELGDEIENYEREIDEKFHMECQRNIELWFDDEPITKKISGAIERFVINRRIENYSNELLDIHTLQRNIKTVKERLQQYEQLIYFR